VSSVIDRIHEDFSEQLEILYQLAEVFSNLSSHGQIHWIEYAIRLHEILLRRSQIVKGQFLAMDDLRSEMMLSPRVTPLNLKNEEQMLIDVVKKEAAEPAFRLDAFRQLHRVRVTNTWWRRNTLSLMLSYQQEVAQEFLIEPRMAFQRVKLVSMLELYPVGVERPDLYRGATSVLEQDTTLAEQFDAPEVFLNEEREEALLSAFKVAPGFHRRVFDGLSGDDSSQKSAGRRGRRSLARTSLARRGTRSMPSNDWGDGRRSARGSMEESTRTTSNAPTDSIEAVQRTPHMDIMTTIPVQLGNEFEVDIYADQDKARPGERIEELIILAPKEVNDFYLDVWLVTSGHFDVVHKPIDKLLIRRGEATSYRSKFILRTKTEAELHTIKDQLPALHKGSITACFSYQGQPCGRVSREVVLDISEQIGGSLEEGELNRGWVPKPNDTIEIHHGEASADMLVEITEDKDVNDGRCFHCRVTTKLEETASLWKIKEGTTSQIVRTYMANFTKSGKTNEQIKAALIGAGDRLFMASPNNFQAAFWRLIDHDLIPETIQIVTEEPHYLWELMVPSRGSEKRAPLGVEFSIARWVTGNSTSPRQSIPITNSYVIAPVYQGRGSLPHADEEAETIRGKFNGERISPATYDEIRKRFKEKHASLVHFACHGKSEDNGVQQALELDDGGELTVNEFIGEEVFTEYFQAKHPLVFLNACEVGRQQAALTGAGGFPAAMIGSGATAVIAPTWSVKDTISQKIALDVYKQLKDDPAKPIASIFREIRKRAYEDGEDTYAAYCFYGHVLATCKLLVGGHNINDLRH